MAGLQSICVLDNVSVLGSQEFKQAEAYLHNRKCFKSPHFQEDLEPQFLDCEAGNIFLKLMEIDNKS